ncbi:hypothetical protein AB1Y20_023654 [Prymnesium parvum]|uniref:Alpha-1,4-N-acetylglucosaminyltransferase n=1 Tax=Prymnesium parvum TaxID=97485 RepID=A0AB34JEB3_PRYPA
MVCPSPSQVQLSPPLSFLQCPLQHDQQTLCTALHAADSLAISLHRHLEARIEKALLRNKVGRCAGWLVLMLLRRSYCGGGSLSDAAFAIRQCEASVRAGEEPQRALGLLCFYSDLAAREPANSSTLVNLTACLSHDFSSRKACPSSLAKVESYQPYAAVRSTPVALRCPSTLYEAPRLGIPPLVHFVYALRQAAPFGFMHLAAVLSAIDVHDPSEVMFHYSYLPHGEFWDAAMATGRMTLRWVDPLAASHFGGRCLRHVAHRADVLRLRVLLRHGGIYLDMDTLSVAPLPPHLREKAEFIIAKQDPLMLKSGRFDFVSAIGEIKKRGYYGLCNAVMAAAPGARFVKHWLDLYSSFRSRGRDAMWDEHSVLLPARLATSCAAFRGALDILPSHRFFPFFWREARSVMLGRSGRQAESLRKKSYIIHLWARGAAYGANGGQIGPSTLAEACLPHIRKTVYDILSCGLIGRFRAQLQNRSTRT